MEVQADPLDWEVPQHPVRLADMVEIGLDANARALVDLRELLVDQAQRVELVLGPILDEAWLVQLDPRRTLLGEALDHLAVDGEERLDQVEGVKVGGNSVSGLPEQQERNRSQDHRDGVDPQLLHRLCVFIERLGGGEREGRVRAQLGDDVVVVRVEPLRHLHRGDVDAVLLAAARHREVGVDVDVAA